jgi:hypothetical protein
MDKEQVEAYLEGESGIEDLLNEKSFSKQKRQYIKDQTSEIGPWNKRGEGKYVRKTGETIEKERSWSIFDENGEFVEAYKTLWSAMVTVDSKYDEDLLD